MKKNLKSIFSAIAAFAVVLSCSKVEGPDNFNDETSGTVTISATLSDVLTKVAFTPSYGNDGKPESLALAWETGDKLRVYDHADKTKYEDFELTAESVGQKTGYFTGVLPVAESYDVEVINGETDYAVQIQPADGVTSSLKYMASASAVSDINSLTFTDYSSVLAITAKLPEGVAAAVASVDITASEAIFNAGKTLTVSLTEKGDAGEDGILNLYANLPQGDQQIPEGTTLLVHFNAPDTDHTVYTRYVELGAQTLTAGKLNTVNINATESDMHAGVVASDGSSAEKAYLIGDKYQMQAMKSLMVAGQTIYFKMVDDVDLTGVTWTPLNDADPYDKAINFDGDSHIVSNLSIEGAEIAYPSFVGNLNGSVNNVTFDKAEIDTGSQKGGVVAGSIGNGDNSGNCSKVTITNSTITSTGMAGALAALANYIGTLSECKVINTSVTSTGARVGGVIGSLVKSTVISNCCTENVTITSSSYYAGGLVGQFDGGGTISGCHSTGSVESKVSGNYSRSGGLIGYLIDGTVENSYSSCSVSSTQGRYLGGLVGQIDKGKISKSYAAGNVNATGHYSGGLVGLSNGSVEVSECYATGAVGGSTNNRRGGLVGNVDKGTITISNCYATGDIISKSYSGGFIGGNEAAGTVNVTNSYTRSSISGHEDAACVFIGFAGGTIEVTGFIGWNVSSRKNWSYNVTSATAPSGNYMGTEGSISAKAKEFNWDETIWDLSGNEPVLKWTLVE